ncbi:MAG: mechanosensitive ion channel family protein [Candidatus Diapherotrites archaeon]|uniref:Mechanosensitive ion channel family protein n=1 Tax=Candidatus Iainarchaeum sp. TaxID=3101447 RepID=A0A8T3YQ31_9ARCH|nr:mechanosensitive ion channel family protein [Candidatus Diapherotrites archaeon]
MAIPELDLLQFAIAAAELVAILAAGYFAGKALHAVFTRAFNALAKNTATQLDDLIFEYIERPMELILIIFILYTASGLVENLSFINRAIGAYLYSILVMLAAYLLSEIAGALLKWAYISHKSKAIDATLIPFARKLSKLLILMFGATIALAALGIDITGILAITSIVGIIVGLASQETLANVFAGLALQIDRPCVYNEYIRLVSGEVMILKKIGVRSTKLEDTEGNIVVMSNSEFAKQRAINLSRRRGGYAGSVPIEFPVSVKAGDAISATARKLGEMAKEGAILEGFQVTADKVTKDAFTITARFDCRKYTDIDAARNGLNTAALEYMQKGGK